MVIGRITAKMQAVVPIQVLGPTGSVASLEAVIDTGYDGFLTLPASVIHDLDLSSAGAVQAALADGSRVKLDLFLAAIAWEGEPYEVHVLATEGAVLLGMAMLTGSRVILDVEDEGAVTIEALAKVRSLH